MKRHLFPGRMLCEHEDRDPGDASKSQGVPKTTAKAPGARREAWHRVSLTGNKRNQSWQYLDLERVASRTVRQYISVV